MNGITRRIRRDFGERFSLKVFNLLVGALFAAVSGIGTLLIKAMAFFASFPFWAMTLIYIIIVIAAAAYISLNKDRPVLRMLLYTAAVAPFGLYFASLISRKFPNWYLGADWVLAGSLICTVSLAILAILSFLLPKWMLRGDAYSSNRKYPVILAVVAFLLGLAVVVSIYNSLILSALWGVVFAAVPYGYAVFTWSYQTGGPITVDRAVSTPSCTLSQVIDWAQSVNSDDRPPRGGLQDDDDDDGDTARAAMYTTQNNTWWTVLMSQMMNNNRNHRH